MSSTYAHYQGPASLPSDYAILSQFAGKHSEEAFEDDHSNSEQEEDSQTENTYLRVPKPSTSRRRSFPSGYIRPQNPTMAPYGTSSSKHLTGPGLPQVSENTPLLNPPVPRIEEAELNGLPDDENRMTMFWEELRILTKYALPVFGFEQSPSSH